MADFMNAAVILAALVNKATVPEIRHLSEVVAVYSLLPEPHDYSANSNLV